MSKQRTPAQNRTLHMLLSRAGLYDDDAREYLQSVCGKSRRSDMDFEDFKKCIRDLELKLGNPLKKTRARAERAARPQGRGTDPITAEAKEHATRLFADLGADARARLSFTRRVLKKDWPQTRADGQKLIQALTCMQRGARRLDGKNKEQRIDAEAAESAESAE
jgi:hypothetical protein